MEKEIKECTLSITLQINNIEEILKNKQKIGKFHKGRYKDLQWQYEKLLNAMHLKLPQLYKNKIKIHILEVQTKIEKIEERIYEKNKLKNQTGLELYI